MLEEGAHGGGGGVVVCEPWNERMLYAGAGVCAGRFVRTCSDIHYMRVRGVM